MGKHGAAIAAGTLTEGVERGWAIWPPIPYSYDTFMSDLPTPSPSPPTWMLSDGQCRPVAERAGLQAHAGLEQRGDGARVMADLGGQGIFGVELFVKGDDVWFSEVSPRPHDTGMVTMVTQWQNEFELHARAILGLPVDTTLKSPGASAVIYGGMEAQGVAFEGVAAALSTPTADLRLFGKPKVEGQRRVGVTLARGADVDAARAAVAAIDELLGVGPRG